ncbi:MAG: Heat-inducible transcriptional repressor [Chlorobi bacterium OLB5]|nr:MAG: Heat-inducible transcriptional repressor [Chlorobi bacterium OLB5]
MDELTYREKVILRCIIEEYIYSANPVGSRYISKNSEIKLSPASVRNVMSDLEELNYLTHNHTSGGRVPTDKGYRYFVNELMDTEPMIQQEKDILKTQINEADNVKDEIYKEVSRILGRLSKEISIVSQPYISGGIFERLELVNLSSTKLLVIVSIKAGLVRTLLFDVETGIARDKIEKITGILNEKLSGLSLTEIRKTFAERIKDIRTDSKEILKVFIDSIDKIFHDEKEGMTLYIGGTTEILSQPEFGDTNNYKNIIELTDEKGIVVHVLNNLPVDEKGISISIGSENKDEKLKDYSIISSEYSVGDVKGRIALIGPKRMNYSKMVSMLDFTSKIITEKF